MSFELSALIAIGIPATGVGLYGLYAVHRLKQLQRLRETKPPGGLPAE